jgi:hypothetical protein
LAVVDGDLMADSTAERKAGPSVLALLRYVKNVHTAFPVVTGDDRL